MSNLNKIYHKGKFRCGEWGKHLRPFLKKQGNKRWRKSMLESFGDETIEMKFKKKNNLPKLIEVRITKSFYGEHKVTRKNKYRTLKAAQNAMNQGNVIQAIILPTKRSNE